MMNNNNALVNVLLKPLGYKDLVILVIAMLLLQLGVTWLSYNSAVIWQQPWRLWTGHWVHAGFLHLLWNLTAFLLLPFVLIHPPRLLFYVLFFLSPLIISLCIYYFNDDVVEYVGLSGVLHALFAGIALWEIYQAPKAWIAWLVLGFIVFKVGAEQWSHHTLSEQLLDKNILFDAHLYGMIIGMGVVLLYIAFCKQINCRAI